LQSRLRQLFKSLAPALIAAAMSQQNDLAIIGHDVILVAVAIGFFVGS
jgi:hypothetical protein